ncbi:MAG: transglutaminase domain-containing protein [Clostridiales bacterium]|nr:transglutaminase domain-containing protein [Clostridiales bacterium]
MLYADYNRKIKRRAAFVAKLRHFKIPIIVACVLIVTAVATILGTRGIISDVSACPSQIVYGEPFTYKASAFLDDVEYEFRREGDDKWVKEQPKLAGNYYVRAVSRRTFGANSYGKVHAFTILPRPLDIKIADTVLYGELPEYTAELVHGDTISISKFDYADISKTATDVWANADYVVITDSDGNEVTGSYKISGNKSPITFIPRDIEITVSDATAEYNGKPLSSSAWELTGGELADGDLIVPYFDKSQTDVGQTENTAVINVSHKILNDDGIDVTANYRIAQITGMLTVKKRTVVINTDDEKREYDGAPFYGSKYTVSEETPIVDGERLEIALAASQTNVGTTENLMVFKAFASDGRDVSDNYTFIVNPGTIEVTPRIISVVTSPDRKTYDGDPLVNEGFAIEGKQLVAGHTLRVVSNTRITDAGSTHNVLGFVVLAADGETDLTYNYTIEATYGMLIVDPREVTVTTDSKEWTYDGDEHWYEEFTARGLISGHSLKVTRHTTITDVAFDDDGEVTTVLNILEFEVEGTLAANYKIIPIYGTLKINKRPVTIETPTKSFVYDGTARRTALPFVSDSSLYDLVKSHGIVAVENGKYGELTNVGETDNVIDFDIVDAAIISKAINYDITVVTGKIYVTARPITITAGDCDKEYDGEPLVNTDSDNYTVNKGEDVGFAPGHTADVTFTGSLTDAGKEKINRISSVIIYAENDENKTALNSNYDITLADGYLEVKPRKVQVTTNSHTWPYDGEPHFDEGFTADRILTEKGHSVSVLTHTEITNVVYDENGGVTFVENVLTFELVGTLASNYDIEIVSYGELKITPLCITVKSNGHSWVYDDKEHFEDGFSIIKGHIANGQAARCVESRVIRYVTDEPLANEFTIEILHYRDGQFIEPNETANYVIEYDYGTIQVTPRPLNITTDSDEFEYDGKGRRVNGFTVKTGEDEGLVPDHRLVIVSDLFKDVKYDDEGNVCGYINYPLWMTIENINTGETTGANGVGLLCNYAYNVTPGTVTVNPRAIKVRAKSLSKVYNAKPIVDIGIGYEVFEGSLVENHYGDAIFNGEYVNAGTYKNCVITGFNVYGDKDRIEDVTKNYDIKIDKSPATFIIDKRPITLVSFGTEDDYEYYNGTYWYYDGTAKFYKVCGYYYEHDEDGNPHPDRGMVFEFVGGSRGFVPLHDVIPDDDSWAAITDAGSCPNTFTARIFDKDGSDVTANYDVTYEYRTLIVLPRPVTVVSWSTDFDYDGDEHYDERFRVKVGSMDFVFDHTLKITSHTTVKNVMRDANGEIIGKENVLGFELINGDVNSRVPAKPSNYDITMEYGTLRVLPRHVKIVTATHEWDYDGKSHFDMGWEVADGSLGFVKDHTLDIVAYTLVKDVMRNADGEVIGTSNWLGYELVGTDADIGNYDIELEYGTLTILPIELCISTPDLEKEYDGEPLNGGSAVITGFLKGHTVILKPNFVSITDVMESGAINAVEVAYVRDSDGNDVTHNYDIVYDFGTLTVTPRPIKVQTASNEWPYDGVTHFDDRFEIIEGTLVVGHELVVITYTQIRDIGEVDNVLTFEVRYGRIDKTPNYDIKVEYGKLKIVKPSGGEGGGDGEGEGDGEGGGGGPRGPIIRLYSEKSGTVYLRLMSYGAYTGKVAATNLDVGGWAAGVQYDGQNIYYNGKEYSVNYLTSILLNNSGMTANNIEVELLLSGTYSLPYYLTLGEDHRYTSDVKPAESALTRYSAEHYMYDYTSDNGARLSSSDLGLFAAVELAYRDFVYRNYMEVPSATAEYMYGIIKEQRFRYDDPSIIFKVAKYIRTAAKYNDKYNKALDSENDVAVAFLDEYKEGVCRHYATAATVLFRTLGFPARYVTGFKASAKAGEWVEIKDGHAWVEVYIDGAGWVMVEVTGSSPNGGGGNGGGEGNGEGEGGEGGSGGQMKESLFIKPVDVTKVYDGTPLYAENEVEDAFGSALKTLLDNGYYYTVVVEGHRVEVGKTESVIVEFNLYDSAGEDVTDKYNITYFDGLVWVTKQVVNVIIPYAKKVYDGKPIVFEELFEGYYGYYWNSLPQYVGNVVIDMGEYEGFTDVGRIGATELASIFDERGLCHVYSPSGEEITDNFTVMFEGGGMEIVPRKIVITAASDEKSYDGTPLVRNEILLPIGGQGLAEGHVIEAKVAGSIIDIGSVENRITSVKITCDGVDVTDNYEISVIIGTLTVKP